MKIIDGRCGMKASYDLHKNKRQHVEEKWNNLSNPSHNMGFFFSVEENTGLF